MRWTKHILTCCAALALTLSCTLNSFAVAVPTETVVRNLDGIQEYVKIYTVPPETDAESLIEPDFEYNGYTYTCTDIIKEENIYSYTKTLTESVSVETEKDDLESILAVLEPSTVYDDGEWRGVLSLDHTTIKTEATGLVSTVDYVGDVVNAGIESITYTITYTGTPVTPAEPTPIPEQEAKPERALVATPTANTENAKEHTVPEFNWLRIAGGALLLSVLILVIILIIVIRNHPAASDDKAEVLSPFYEASEKSS